MAEIVQQHKEELRVYRLVNVTDLALKSQLIDTFEEMYFSRLRNRHTGFTGVMYMNMITHLYLNYGVISAIDIMENEKRMDMVYDASVAIEAYFEQIESAVEFAEAGNCAFTTTQITTKTFIQMFATGLFKDECKAWNYLVPLSHTWPTFKLIFTTAARKLREMQVLTGNTGYANNVEQTQELMKQTANALSTLAQAQIEDRESVANVLTTTNNLAAKLAADLARPTLISNCLTAIKTGQQVDSGQANTGGRQHNHNNNAGNKSYCHTHGCTRRNDHTSASCNHPAEGHIATATLGNRQGGSNS